MKTDINKISELIKKNNYWITNTKSSSGKERLVHAPKPDIKKIQKQLQKFLSRIETPDFLFSGKKGLYYKDNAEYHINTSNYLLNLDISSFYTSCQREFIFKCFHYKFCMSQDVAWLMTDIVSFENYIPTGSPCSQLIAYFTYEDTFLRIQNIAVAKGLAFSLYVDDMTFSSINPIPSDFDQTINEELLKVGLTIKKKKTTNFFPSQHKLVTGCVISPTKELKVRNQKRKDIIQCWHELHRAKEKCPQAVQSLLGKVVSVRQIEPDLFISYNQYLSDLHKTLSKIDKVLESEGAK